MKKEKIFKMQFISCNFRQLKNKVTECTITFDFNIDAFEEAFGTPSRKVKKAISGLGLTFVNGHVAVKGYAKCTGGDVFNKTIGERIAEAKAKRNAYRVGVRVGKIIEKEVRRELVDVMRFNELMLKCERCEVEHAEFIESDLN